jgi:hypothetical protein
MELTGKLSDFGLSDILQILALSKKTGTLSISNGGVEGQVVIEDGRITHACMRPGEGFASYLLQEGLLSESMLQRLIEVTTNGNKAWDFSSLVIESGIFKQDELQKFARLYMLKVIGNLLRLERGHFGIVLNEIGLPGLFDEVKLLDGVGIEEVLLRDAKEYDELSRQEMLLFQPINEKEKKAEDLIDNLNDNHQRYQTGNLVESLNAHHNRYQTGSLNGNRIEEQHAYHTGSLNGSLNGNHLKYQTGSLNDFQAGKADLSTEKGVPSGAVNELNMQSLVSVVGVSNMFTRPVDAMSSSFSPPLANKEFARNGLSESEEEDGFGLLNDETLAEADKLQSYNSHILCSMLAELRSLSFEAEVSLSVMRYASEVASRGILFVVKEEELCGLGQFGVDRQPNGGSVDDQVRAIHIPVKVQSVFTNVVKTGMPYVGSMNNGYWNLEVISRLGETGHELNAFVLPIFCRGKVMFVIYGDNYPGGNKDFDGFEEFLVFVNQASVVLENIVMERELSRMHDM